MHRYHHRSKVVRIEHRRSCFFFLDPFVTPKQFEPMAEVVQVFAFGWIDDAHSLQRDVEPLCSCFYGRSVAEQDRCAQSERIELARSLQDARLGPFRKYNPFRMPLKLLDQTANKSHAQTTNIWNAKLESLLCANFATGPRVSRPARATNCQWGFDFSMLEVSQSGPFLTN